MKHYLWNPKKIIPVSRLNDNWYHCFHSQHVTAWILQEADSKTGCCSESSLGSDLEIITMEEGGEQDWVEREVESSLKPSDLTQPPWEAQDPTWSFTCVPH